MSVVGRSSPLGLDSSLFLDSFAAQGSVPFLDGTA